MIGPDGSINIGAKRDGIIYNFFRRKINKFEVIVTFDHRFPGLYVRHNGDEAYWEAYWGRLWVAYGDGVPYGDAYDFMLLSSTNLAPRSPAIFSPFLDNGSPPIGTWATFSQYHPSLLAL